MSEQTNEPPRFWNGWWTATLIAAVFTIVVAILEALGVFHDVGVALGFIGVALTTFFGAASATKTSTKAIHYEIHTMHDTMRHILLVLNQIRDRL